MLIALGHGVSVVGPWILLVIVALALVARRLLADSVWRLPVDRRLLRCRWSESCCRRSSPPASAVRSAPC